MKKSQLDELFVYESDTIYLLAWKYLRRKETIYVLDSEDRLVGCVGQKELNETYYNNELTITDIVNRHGKIVDLATTRDIYAEAAGIFALNAKIKTVPVIENGFVIDILTRERVFFEQLYKTNKLKRQHYADNLWQAATEAKALGYKKISSIEFGVAGGTGLEIMENYAKEIGRIWGIEIEVYGFDTGSGMPELNAGYKDLIHWWGAGDYVMNVEYAKARLDKAILVIGNIADTLAEFVPKYNPAPLGCICIDVDYYSSTIPILTFLEHVEEIYIMPRIYMYFDDVLPKYEFSGETLAIKELNGRSDMRKISPELTYDLATKNKIFHTFNHSKYNQAVLSLNKILR